MTLVIVFIGAISDYYFGAIGAVLSALVVIASMSKSKAEVVIPSLLLVGLAWAAGAILANGIGAIVGVILAVALSLWLESGARIVMPRMLRTTNSWRNPTRFLK